MRARNGPWELCSRTQLQAQPKNELKSNKLRDTKNKDSDENLKYHVETSQKSATFATLFAQHEQEEAL